MSNQRSRTDRRRYLKYTGVAAITALAGCSGGNGGDSDAPTHEVPHPDDDVVPDAEANAQSLIGQARPDDPTQTKADVDYQHTPNGEQYCGNCSLFVPDANGDGFGACVSVGGKIHHCDYCALYSPYDGDGVVPCQ
ncbi:MAG: hypothetical protein ABEJ76_05605 [Halanaeroarchaeum sp.]